MKKKQIEKVPYTGITKLIRSDIVRYIATVALVTIAGEEHLIVEVYRNQKGYKEIPVARVVLTQKDFSTYLPYEEKWTQAMVESVYGRNRLLWENGEDVVGTYRDWEKRNVLKDQKDVEVLEKFTGEKIYNKNRWWEYVEKKMNTIGTKRRNEARNREYERRQNALKERMEHTPELPEQEILKYADGVMFMSKHYLYYKKRGNHADIACSFCGGVTSARWKAGMSYESNFERQTAEPREGRYGTCPMCGARGIYKCQGKVKGSYSEYKCVFLGNRYKENGMVVRYVEVEKRWQLGTIAGKKGPEMFNALEELSGVEIARAYFEEGKKLQIDYHKHSPYSGKDYWDDCNLYGINNISIGDGNIMPQFYEQMKNTMFRYSGLQEYMALVHQGNPIKYLQRYVEVPQLEMLIKLNLTELAKWIVDGNYGIIGDRKAKRLDEFLEIRKERVKLLIEHKGDIPLLRVLKMEKLLEENWTEEIIKKLEEADITLQQITMPLQFLSITKILNYIEKYAGCEFGSGCSSATAQLKHIATTYLDYLHMRRQRGYDMTNTVYLRPRNLGEAHNAMVMEINKDKEDAHMKKMETEYPLIRKNYRALRKRYFYESDELLIRPARSASEIVLEGRTLHHCVGGTGYLRGHNEQSSIICFVRFKKNPDVPYVTVEVMDTEIKQWYGANDKKPDKNENEAFLEQWLLELENRRKSESRLAAV